MYKRLLSQISSFYKNYININEPGTSETYYIDYMKDNVISYIDYKTVPNSKDPNDRMYRENIQIDIHMDSGKVYTMYHIQDCCEQSKLTTNIEDIIKIKNKKIVNCYEINSLSVDGPNLHIDNEFMVYTVKFTFVFDDSTELIIEWATNTDFRYDYAIEFCEKC